jgi:hypothetical protein
MTFASDTPQRAASPPRSYYVAPAPTGSPLANGSERHPWDLATALAGGPTRGTRVQPGDTIWVRGGTYRGAFRSTVAGSDGAPVVIRQFPGERAVMDGAGSTSSTLYVTGAHSVFWGLELTNSDPARSTSSADVNLRPNAVVNDASYTKYVNLIVHDGGVGFYNEPKSVDVEIAGCIMYNNGWQGPDRGHAHALYLKSFVGPLMARDNILFNQYGYGVHAYTNSKTGKLMNISIEANIAFNNGALATQRAAASNILLGGADYAGGDVVRDNVAYYSPTLTGAGANMMIGYRTLRNGDVIVENNFLVGGSPVLDFGFWSAARVSNNMLLGGGVRGAVVRRDAAAVGQIWRDNTERAAPSATRVIVHPNLYEQGRAHVVVFNWGNDTTAQVDVSGVLAAGDRYDVRNVQDLFGAPIASGTAAGTTISIPLRGVEPPIPVGLTASRAPKTGPAFDVFLITRQLQH